MKFVFVFIFLFAVSLGAFGKAHSPRFKTCPSSKEFVTVYNFLAESDDYELKKNDRMALSHHVSKGCEGSAARFVRVSKLLTRVGLSTSDTLSTAKEISHLKEEQARIFEGVFKRAFASDFLDLPLGQALTIAKKLSLDFQGDPEIGGEDFIAIAKFCAQTKVALPLSTCASFASKLALSSAGHKSGLSEGLIRLYGFLTQEDGGPQMASFEGMELAMEVMTQGGPHGDVNFRHAYRFAVERKELSMKRNEAIEFAKNLGLRSSQKLEAPAQADSRI